MKRLWLVLLMVTAGAGAAVAQPVQLGGVPCARPPVLHCPETGCPAETVVNGGPVTESKTGRTYFLDYPCNLRKGEKVTLILSLHGGGSYGNWQRHYFPLLDYVDKYRLVVATPNSPRRVWAAEDDAYLQNIVSDAIEQLGRAQIKAFWLAGHSQGGLTSTRLVCSDFFRTKVDGFLSLSGGRVGGQAGRAAGFGVPPATGAATGRGAAAPALPAGALTPPPPPACDFSHIFTTGEHEISALPDVSERAAMYGCSSRKRREVTDTKAGYVHDGSRQNPGTKAWGLLPRPGTAKVYTFQGCRDSRVVADVVRLDKGHTEGLEPRVTETLIRLMLDARGGKLQQESTPAQTRLPADIHPESLSRVPPVQRADLDADGQRIWDLIAGTGKTIPRTGPAAVTMHSPKAAEPIQALNQVLRKTVVGPRYFELSALIAAREFDQQYEWSGHEPAGLRAGLEQAVIDVVKFNRDPRGLPEKDATVIRLGRAIFRDHKVSPELWAKTVEFFGRQGAVEIATIMGDYAMAAVFLIAVDQQLPPGRPAMLPTR